jgi:hypothetical protein
MAKHFFTLFLTLCVGCSTPATLRNTVADIDITSAKMAKIIAICIADRWESGAELLGATVPITMRETSTGYAVMWLNGTGGVGMLADVTSEVVGSRTQYRRGGVLGSSKFEASLRDCQ